jgi:transposase
MFIRKKKNHSGSMSIQIVTKISRKNKILKSVGFANSSQEEKLLLLKAKTEMEHLRGIQSLFVEHDDTVIENFVDSLSNNSIQIVGPELILGKLYQKIGYPDYGDNNLFKNLVLCRLVYPGSKLKTVKYFKRHLDIDISVYSIYRFMDELQSKLKQRIEEITFEYSRKILRGRIGVVFYDMTTLYFEASEEDEFRIQGFSKDGKHQQPQIIIGLLVGKGGYPIGYEIFEGNTSETNTLIPVLEIFQKKFDIGRPIVVADAALLSKNNIKALIVNGYKYILGGRLKNESEEIKSNVLELNVQEGCPKELHHPNGRLVVTYSGKRAHKDKRNREKGLKRLEKKVKSGKLTKEHINNRGYNKYLKLIGDIKIEIDYDKYNADIVWDGLKGYITNTSLTKNEVIGNYQHLWQIEKAFRISKTDLRIRPVYHRIKNRIKSHLCICFTAYTIYKELERVLVINKIPISAEEALTELKDIMQIKYILPKSGQLKTKLLKLNDIQTNLVKMKI